MVFAWSVAAQKLIDQSYSTKVALSDQARKQMRKQAKQQALNDVFGVGHKVDKDGNPIEQGIGSPGNGSIQDAESFKRWHGPNKENPMGEPGWEETYKLKLKNAHETSARRKKLAIEDDDDE